MIVIAFVRSVVEQVSSGSDEYVIRRSGCPFTPPELRSFQFADLRHKDVF